MNQNDALGTKISNEKTRTTLKIDLREIPPLLIRISIQDQTSHMGTTIRKKRDHMANAKNDHSKETMETGVEMVLSAIRSGTGETMEKFLVLHRLKGETSHKKLYTANQK